MDKKVFFSIIIPTYNNASFLKIAINSVLSQTYPNYEILVIDNNSVDNTTEIIKSFDDHRLFHYEIKNDGIISRSRNLGITLSKGNWLAFLDSDDNWYKTRLETIYKIIIKKNFFDVFITNEYMVYVNKNKKEKLIYGPLLKNKYKSLLLYGNRLSPSATIIRKDFLKKNNILFNENINFITVEDYDLWMMMAFYNANFKFIPKFEGEYLIHGNNSSRKIEMHTRNLFNLINHHVFNIQEFSNNKNHLLKMIITSRKFINLLKNKSNKNFASKLSKLFLLFKNAPIFIINFFVIRIYFFIFNKIKLLINY